MEEEKDKLDLEDIKDPEDLDIDAAVSEEDAPKEEEVEVEEKEEVPEEKDVLEKAEEEPTTIPEGPVKKKSAKMPNKKLAKNVAIGGLVILVLVAAVLGGLYYLQQKNKADDASENTQTEQTKEEVVVEEETEEEATGSFRYINSEVGLNMRETPDTKAKVLAIIPYGTKITVLEEQTGWVKTTYDNKTGWVSVDYTQETSPLVYENTTYGFGLTFKASWAGYKFIEASNSGSTTVKTYYVALPTTDKKWSEPGIPAGYASLFVMGVYTKEEWAKLAGGEMLPAKLGEGTKYVYTYLPGQAHASDLATQYSEIKAIIETFEVLN
jgi:hypothetical protein